MDILFLIIVFAAGYFVGTMKAYITFAREIKDAAEAVGLDIDKELAKQQAPEKTVHKLIIEKHGDMLYLFDRERDSFICQGSTIQELAELAVKYKNIISATAIYDNKVFMFYNGNSKEYISDEN